MYKFDSTLLAELSGYNLIDPNLSLAEVYSQANKNHTDTSNTQSNHLDNNTSLNYKEKVELFRQLELAFSNGVIWETELDDFIPNPDVENSFFLEAINHRNQVADQSLEKVLEEFDSWAGSAIDILSPYGDIDLGHNFFADDFEMNVPVKIVSEDEDLVFKVDAPWMKVNNFKDKELYPSKLNLKSVLSALPVRIKSNEIKASFIDGQFRLEIPKKEIVLDLKSKNA